MKIFKSKKSGETGAHTAVLVPVTCGETQKAFYARYDKAYSGKWVLAYGVKDVPSTNEKFVESFKIDLSDSMAGPQYKCPYCGARHFAKCGACGKLTCFDWGRDFKCAHCGHQGEVSRTESIKELHGSSGGGQ